MRRIRLLMAAVVGAALCVGGARAEPESLPATPEPLRQFEGSLYGEVERVARDSQFTGLVLKVSLVETPSGGIAPAQVSGVAGARVALAVPLDRSGRPLREDLGDMLRRLRTGDPVRVEAQAEGPQYVLYVRSLQLLSERPAETTPQLGMTPAAPDAPPPAAVASPDDLQRMAAELQAMRRELARLQQDVADLRATAMDLARR